MINQNESLIAVIALLYKWRKHIIGATILAGIVTAGASLLMPNYYESHTLFYAANPDLAAPMSIAASAEEKQVFGSDNDLDRLFSISKSGVVLDQLNAKYKLYENYDINPDDRLAKHKLNLKFSKLYNTTKTKYDAIDLSVEDKNPELAYKMTNEARDIIDSIAQQLLKESQRKQIQSYESGIASKEAQYSLLIDSLNRSRTKYAIFSSESQGEAYGSSMVEVEGKYLKATGTLAYLKNTSAPRDSIEKIEAVKNGLERQLTKLKADIKNYNQGYPIVKNLERVTRDFSAYLQLDKTRLASLKATYDSKITAVHIIEEATVPVYKSRPKRSILVLGVAFLTFVMMSLWVLIKDQYQKRNWKEAFNDV